MIPAMSVSANSTRWVILYSQGIPRPHSLLEYPHRALGHPGDVEPLPHGFPSARAHRSRLFRIAKKLLNRGSQRLRIVRLAEQAAAGRLDQFGESGVAGLDDGNACGQRFEHVEPKRLPISRR